MQHGKISTIREHRLPYDMEALKTRILSLVPPKVIQYCGRLLFVGGALIGLLTFVNLLAGAVPSFNLVTSKYGFWPVPPKTTIPFAGFGQGRCVPLFQAASILKATFPDSIFLYSYYNAEAIIGVCTKAPIVDVDSIFGSQNRMFKTTVPDISSDSPERRFVISGGGPGNLFKIDHDPDCTSVAKAKRCCVSETASIGGCAAAFTDVVPQGFNSVSFWKSYIGIAQGLITGNGCDDECGMYVTDSQAPLCNQNAGFNPVFYNSLSLSFFYYTQFATAGLAFQCFLEVAALVVAKRTGGRSLVCGNFCPFFFALTWIPGSPMYVDTDEDDFDPSERLSWGVFFFDNFNMLFSGVVYTGLQMSGGCSSFPGRNDVVALLVFNIFKFIYRIFAWLTKNKQGSLVAAPT